MTSKKLTNIYKKHTFITKKKKFFQGLYWTEQQQTCCSLGVKYLTLYILTVYLKEVPVVLLLTRSAAKSQWAGLNWSHTIGLIPLEKVWPLFIRPKLKCLTVPLPFHNKNEINHGLNKWFKSAKTSHWNIIIMSNHQHGYHWPFWATLLYWTLLSAGLQATSFIGTDLLDVGSSWSSYLCSSMWTGP